MKKIPANIKAHPKLYHRNNKNPKIVYAANLYI
jgi:hypothetical protein